MVLEVAILNVKPSQEPNFERAFGRAQRIISAAPGYVSHQLQRCIEQSNRYILLVNWESLEDPTVGFRQSKPYEEWRELQLVYEFGPYNHAHHYTAAGGGGTLVNSRQCA